MAGEVVGITTLYLKGGENLNFAIPINDAKHLLQDKFAAIGGKRVPQQLPNEPESVLTDAHSSTSDEKPIAQMNSPAYQSYQELLKSGDAAFISSTYACFDDDQQSRAFMVINPFLMDKEHMTVMIQEFVDGISKWSHIFSGSLSRFSGAAGLFATLPTNAVGGFSSNQTDIFEWGPDVLSMKTGFGKLSPGQVRSSYEFDMQRSTGRYSEQTVFDKGAKPDGFTINKTGRCIRIPNIGQTPEEAYRFLK